MLFLDFREGYVFTLARLEQEGPLLSLQRARRLPRVLLSPVPLEECYKVNSVSRRAAVDYMRLFLTDCACLQFCAIVMMGPEEAKGKGKKEHAWLG